MSDDKSDASFRVRHIAPAESVPLFNCLVYVRHAPEGVRARVGNLQGFQVEAESERQALQKLIPQFKSAMQRYAASGEEIPWLTSPQPEADEQERLIAVHL